jgi:hypothetical protein
MQKSYWYSGPAVHDLVQCVYSKYSEYSEYGMHTLEEDSVSVLKCDLL